MLDMSGRGKTRGMSGILTSPCACSQSVAAIIPDKEKLSSEFLHYDLAFRYEEIRNITGSHDRSGLNLRLIREIRIPLPPLDEQQEISRVLLAIDEHLKEEQNGRHHFSELKKGLLQALL